MDVQDVQDTQRKGGKGRERRDGKDGGKRWGRVTQVQGEVSDSTAERSQSKKGTTL